MSHEDMCQSHRDRVHHSALERANGFVENGIVLGIECVRLGELWGSFLDKLCGWLGTFREGSRLQNICDQETCSDLVTASAIDQFIGMGLEKHSVRLGESEFRAQHFQRVRHKQAQVRRRRMLCRGRVTREGRQRGETMTREKTSQSRGGVLAAEATI